MLVGLELEGNETAGHGDEVYVGRQRVGVVTSGTRSPVLRKNIALCRMAVQYGELGTDVEVGKLDGLQKRIPAKVVRVPVLRPRQDAPALLMEAGFRPGRVRLPAQLHGAGRDRRHAVRRGRWSRRRPDVEGDDPAVALRRVLGQFATGVTVITTLKGEQVHGMTANAFMSVSLEPPLVLVSVDRRTKMCGLLHEGSHYGVSVLCETQSALSDRFAGRPGEDLPDPRFAVVRETPLVDGALAHFVASRPALLLGRRPLAVPGPRGVRAPPLGLPAAVPRRALRAAQGRLGSSDSQALRAPVSSQSTGKNDSSSDRSPRRR